MSVSARARARVYVYDDDKVIDWKITRITVETFTDKTNINWFFLCNVCWGNRLRCSTERFDFCSRPGRGGERNRVTLCPSICHFRQIYFVIVVLLSFGAKEFSAQTRAAHDITTPHDNRVSSEFIYRSKRAPPKYYSTRTHILSIILSPSTPSQYAVKFRQRRVRGKTDFDKCVAGTTSEFALLKAEWFITARARSGIHARATASGTKRLKRNIYRRTEIYDRVSIMEMCIECDI